MVDKATMDRRQRAASEYSRSVAGQTAAAPGGAAAAGGGADTAFRQQYGPWAWAIDHPEIGPVLRRAEQQNYSPEQLQAEIQSTEWWRTTAGPARAWVRTNNLDPAEASRLRAAKYEEVWDLAHRLSDEWGAEALKFFEQTTENAIRLGWDQNQVISELMRYAPQAAFGSGALRSTGDQVRQMASQYAVPVSDQWVNDISRAVAMGEKSIEDAQAYFKDQALARFPSLKAVIDAGYTVRQYVEPYVQDTVRELGINAAEVNLVDPKWGAMLDGQVDKQTGMRVAFSRDEWISKIRTDAQYGWDRKQGAKDQALQFRAGLRETFGLEG